MSDNDNDANDWISDLTSPSGSSVFEDSFRSLVEDGDLSSMAPTTLENQVDRIDDPELLADAIEAEDREEVEEALRDRLGEVNADRQDEEADADGSDDDEEEVTLDEDPDDSETDGGSMAEDLLDDESEEVDAEAVAEEAEDLVQEDDEDDGEAEEASVDSEGDTDGASDRESESSTEPDPSPSETDESPQTANSTSSDDRPDVDVSRIAPGAVSIEEAAQAEKERSLLVWGPEGSGKSHVAHTAPGPVAYIDTEGKADELASKFSDKQIWYWTADDYKEAKSAMEEAFDVLAEFLDAGIRGTIVVDSMTAMWEYAKVDWAEYKYQTDDLSEVTFNSQLQGDKDWTEIKARHNAEFRERILDSDYHVVMTAGEKEDYNAAMEGEGKRMKPDGEKWNKYAVKDVVKLRRDDDGTTVGDLRKAARTRYSFVGLEWPTFDSVYDAIDDICSAEQADEAIDLSDWPFEVVDGQPTPDTPDGSDGGDES